MDLPHGERVSRSTFSALSKVGQRAEGKSEGNAISDGSELEGEYIDRVVVVVVVVAAAISVSKGATFALHCFALRTKKKRDVDRREGERDE